MIRLAPFRSAICAALLLSTPAYAEGSAPKPLMGPTLATGHTLSRGAPSPVALGFQGILPKGPWRFAAETFVSSPSAAFTPAVGLDLGAGLVNKNGLGGALALYGRRTLGADGLDGSTQVGPGALLLAKVSPGLIVGTPLVFWYDLAGKTWTPTLTIKLILGLPVGG